MYYVYYIKGIKIGCTKNLKKRVEQEQGYKDYTILFKSKDIKKASNAERYFQEQLGYKVDLNTYENLTNNKTKTKKMIKKTNHTVTFKVEKSNINKKFLLNLGVINDLNGRDIIICEELSDWILKNLKKSQFNNEMFIYNQSLINAYDFLIENKELENLNIFDLIRQWAEDKGIYKSGDARTQFVKLMEEAGELAQAILKNDEPEVIDAIGDMVVVLTNLAKLRGHNIEDCITSAYDVISNRTGKMINGTFVKQESLSETL